MNNALSLTKHKRSSWYSFGWIVYVSSVIALCVCFAYYMLNDYPREWAIPIAILSTMIMMFYLHTNIGHYPLIMGISMGIGFFTIAKTLMPHNISFEFTEESIIVSSMMISFLISCVGIAIILFMGRD